MVGTEESRASRLALSALERWLDSSLMQLPFGTTSEIMRRNSSLMSCCSETGALGGQLMFGLPLRRGLWELGAAISCRRGGQASSGRKVAASSRRDSSDASNSELNWYAKNDD